MRSIAFFSKNVPASGNRSRNGIQSIHTNPNTKTKIHGNREVDELSKVDHVVTSAKPSHFEAQLYISEDNEVVIKKSLSKAEVPP